MNRYILAAAAAAAAVCCMVSCSGKNSSESSSGESPAAQTTAEVTAAAQTTETSTAAETKSTSALTTKAEVKTTAAQSGGFVYDADGAVKFDAPVEAQDDSTLIEAAQALFGSACAAEWNFTVGSPYELDMADYVTGKFDWQFFRITSAGVSSMDDVRADYHKVFSDKYPDKLDEVFLEQNGSVYALNGARGQDIFYSNSRVTSLDRRTDDELFFTVTNYYNGSPAAPDTPYTEEEEFSAVIAEDGTLRAGKFRLPY